MKVQYGWEFEGKVWGGEYGERGKGTGYEREGMVERYGWV